MEVRTKGSVKGCKEGPVVIRRSIKGPKMGSANESWSCQSLKFTSIQRDPTANARCAPVTSHV